MRANDANIDAKNMSKGESLSCLCSKNVKIFHNNEDFARMCSSDCAEDVYRIEAKRVQE